MHPSFLPIDVEELKRLYVDEGFTMARVAARLGCGATTIGRRLHALSIPRRSRGPAPAIAGCHRSVVASPAILWSSPVAYAVGIIATDGNLSRQPGRLTLVSKDTDLLHTLRQCLDLMAPMRPHRSGYGGGPCYHIAWSDRPFYDALLALGVTPAKSRTLSALLIPDDYFADFLRGCIDGDGSIITYTDRYNTFKKPTYVYTRLYVSIVSASSRFLEWLRATIRKLTGMSGELAVSGRGSTGNMVWRLRYAKRESLALLRWIYYAPDLPALRRKQDIAAPFLHRPEAPRRPGPGRPMVV